MIMKKPEYSFKLNENGTEWHLTDQNGNILINQPTDGLDEEIPYGTSFDDVESLCNNIVRSALDRYENDDDYNGIIADPSCIPTPSDENDDVNTMAKAMFEHYTNRN